MSSKLTINNKNIKAIRKSPKVTADLFRRGRHLADACGPGFTVQGAPSKNRARVTVFADTSEAIHENAAHNVLVRNLDAAR